jgi:hypothetical protein
MLRGDPRKWRIRDSLRNMSCKIKATLRAQIMLAYFHPWSITLQSCGIARARQRQDPLLFEYVGNPDVSSSMVPSARSARLRCPPQCFRRPHCLPFSAGRQALIVSPDVALSASLRNSTCFCQNIPVYQSPVRSLPEPHCYDPRLASAQTRIPIHRVLAALVGS